MKQTFTKIFAICFLAFGAIKNNANAQGSALNFDGINDYVSLPTASIIPQLSGGKVSISAWVNMTSRPNLATIIKNWGDATIGAFHFGLDGTTGKMSIAITQSDGNYVSLTSPNVLSTGAWHNVAFTADGTTLKLYENGSVVASAAYDGTLKLDCQGTFIGVKPNDFGTSPSPGAFAGYWDGAIDELRIWNKGLSACEVNGAMNCELSGSQTGLLAYYKCNQGIAAGNNTSITALTDASGNGYDGTLRNFGLTSSTSNFIANGGVTTGVSCGPLPSPSNNITTMIACNSYTWNGRTYTASTTDTFSYLNGSGCLSVDTLKLTINQSSSSTFTTSACDSFYWAAKNVTYYASNTTDTVTLTNAAGCDSVVTLNLTINYGDRGRGGRSTCYSYTWNGTTYTQSGTYTYIYNNSFGCTSYDTLDLIIRGYKKDSTTTTACNSFDWRGKTLTASGIYKDTSSNGVGCDSINILNLTINTSTHNVTTHTACDSYTWHGRNYTTNAIDTFSYVNALGCYSVDTLKLTINISTHNVTTQIACDSYSWQGRTYTANTVDTFSYVNASGCFSVDTLKLTINYSPLVTLDTTACGSFIWRNKTYTTSGIYRDTVVNVGSCDSLFVLNLGILTNIASIDIVNSGAYCGDTAKTQLKTNISATNFPGVTYAWTKQDFISNSWSMFSNDSVVNISDVYPTQYVVQVSIPGCGNFFSNQKMVMPVTNPTVSLAPSPTTSICNNTNINFIAASADSGVNNYSFWKATTQVQSGSGLTYSTPNLTTADNGVVYTVQATNVKPTFDGNITENFWGKPLAVSVWGPSPGFGAGHELNAVYSRADANNIYIAIAGNVQNGNRIMMFIDSKTGGYQTGNYGRNGIGNNGIKNFNSGNVFDPGFLPDYCLGIGTDAARSQFYFDLVEMKGNATTGTSVNNYIGSNLTPASGYSIGANPANNTQTQGFEIAIPKANVGYTNGDIRIFVMYSADNGFLSNQFLTKALISSGNYGNGIVNFGFAAPGHIAIPISSLASTACKAEVTTTVTVKANATSVKHDTVCRNMLPYHWGAKTYAATGSYNDTALGSNGCDSIATLHLLVKDTTTSTTAITKCNNQLPYNWNTVDYTTAGTYTWKGTNAAGCDSIATLIFTVSDTTTSTITLAACDSIWWNGIKYTASGTYTWKGMNAAGCDSMATLNLTIRPTLSTPIITIANNIILQGQTGVVYTCSLSPNANGYTWSYTGTGATIIAGQGTTSITIDFANNATGGQLQVMAINNTFCNSLQDTMTIAVQPLPITMGNFSVTNKDNKVVLNWNSITEVNAKEYQVQRSVDGRNFEQIGTVAAKGMANEYQFTDNRLPNNLYTIYYKLKMVDKDGKYSYSPVRQLSILNTQFSIRIYPNPTKNILNIKAANATQVRIVDVVGKQVYQQKLSINGLWTVDCGRFASGTYFVEVLSKDGTKQVEKFVKE